MTQTAVQWLVERYFASDEPFQFKHLEQALQMEKEQHEDTWLDSRIESNDEDNIGKEKSFEQYYEQTYGGKP